MIAPPPGPGINLAGQYEAKPAAWMRPFKLADFDQIYAAGFRTIRLPVDFETAADANGVVPEPTFAPVQEIMDHWCWRKGVVLVIDSHVNAAFWATPTARRARTMAMIGNIANRFRRAPANVWFEPFNEPPMPNALMLPIWGTAIAAIRATNPTRPIVIGAGYISAAQGWGWSPAALATLRLPDDPYLIPSFHQYRPFDLTHVGYAWTKPAMMPARKMTAADVTAIAADAALVRAYVARTGRVPWMGEFGVSEHLPVETRAEWFAATMAAFAPIGVSPTIWGYANAMPVRDDKGFYPEIVKAVTGHKL